MGRGKPAPGAESILSFYDTRGYRNAVGTGQHPAIVVIDFSNAFTRGASQFPGGDFGSEMAQTCRLLSAARERGLPVFYTTIAYADPEKDSGFWGKKVPWLSRCKLGSDAVAIDTVLDPQPGEPVIVKKFPSAFFETDLQDRLHTLGIDTIVLAGCTTSVCIRATAIDAMQRNFHALVAAEAVGDLDPTLHAVHLRDIDARYADVMSVDDLLAYFHSLPLMNKTTNRDAIR
jgi:nicotinamidase-related amidase